jgi:hypothetical protein
MSDDVAPTQQGYSTWQTPFSNSSDRNSLVFQIEQVMARMNVATLVSVKKATTQGQVGPVGFVNVVPMVNMVDGQGIAYKHGQVSNIPFFRLHSKDKAIIMDPKADDIGLAIFADKDISAVKNGKKVSPPGSFRRFDMADGLYLGSFLAGTPKSYIQFTDDNKIVTSPDEGNTKTTLEQNKITLQLGDNVSVIMEPTKITLKVNSMKIVMKSDRIDLGDDPAPFKVVTSGGESNAVFAILDPPS